MGAKFAVLCSFPLLLGMICSLAEAQLSVSYYANTCPSVFDVVRAGVRSAVNREPRMGASLMRLFFHDCFVNGCDASILLDAGGEKMAPPNDNSVRGYGVIDNIKTQLNTACGGNVVSCADIIAIAARDSVVELGGPSYAVPLGRRDSRTGFPNLANSDLPGFTDDLDVLLRRFGDKGLSPRDLVALSGSHTVGQARCVTFRGRIYGGANIDPAFATLRQANCPNAANQGDNNLAPLDEQSPNRFGNNYFQALINKRALLHTDQVLYNGNSTDSIVTMYSNDYNAFAADFASAMVKMGNLAPGAGTQLEVRADCKRAN